ncbi:hypothetical protein RT42_GL000494 [Enterococcus cecorum DSM 20682 = ATCC 43198]|nr:hypothetical protein RT42_GL000494 [Enterococcus cecorum DSM 20682 = ATCC 43198]
MKLFVNLVKCFICVDFKVYQNARNELNEIMNKVNKKIISKQNVQ